MGRLYTHVRTLAWIVAALTLLSACGSLRSWWDERRSAADDRSDHPIIAEEEVASEEEVVAPLPTLPPVARAAPPARPPPVRAATPRFVRPVMPAPVVSIAGLGEDDVRRVMGEPQEKLERDGRKVWTYRGAGCRVEVTFFRDVTSGDYAALAHKVVRTNAGNSVDEGVDGACVQDVRRAARE